MLVREIAGRLCRALGHFWRPRSALPTSPALASPVELRLYTKAGCPLCDEMKAELARARVRPPFRLVEIDIERDATLLALHGRSVPVLEIAGRPAFKGRLTAAEFERKYARHLAEIRARTSRERSAAGESEHG